MASISCNKQLKKIWIALKRLDQNDERVIALREVSITRDAEVATVKNAITHSFGLASHVTLKIRNSRGSLIPLNNSLPVSSKQRPHVLEVAKTFQHVIPRPRVVAMTVIHKSLKSRLQSVVRRIERLEELLPQIKLQHHDKMNKDIELLNQKLIFLHKRMKIHAVGKGDSSGRLCGSHGIRLFAVHPSGAALTEGEVLIIKYEG